MLESKNIRRNHNSVPILSKSEMDALGEDLVKRFSPELLNTPGAFDIESFIELEMGLRLDFAYLSHCRCYLGMMAFDDMTVATWEPRTNQAEYISVKAGTVLIDSTLLEDGQENRLRFTLGHESVGHAYLHRPYYHKDQNQMSMFDDRLTVSPCKRVEAFAFHINQSDTDWMEWQADYMAAAVLMPKSAVMKLLIQEREEYGVERSFSNAESFGTYITSRVSSVFQVSQRAAQIRINHLFPNKTCQPLI